MKRFYLLIFWLSCINYLGYSQNSTQKEEQAIIQTALDYGDGFLSGDADRMQRAIHPDLNKVCPMVLPQTGKTFFIYSTYSALIELSRAKVGFTEESQRKIAVKVLKVNEDVACAKITTALFNDYLELVKTDGQWKIINVLWTFGPDSPNRKTLPDFKGDGEKPAVEAAVRDLIEGIYTSDLPRVEKVLHPEYKRATPIPMQESGRMMIQRDATGSMIENVRAKVGAQNKEKWNIQVNVLDCMDGLALAELITPSGWSYCQLAKIDGQWKIINMLRKINPDAQQKK